MKALKADEGDRPWSEYKEEKNSLPKMFIGKHKVRSIINNVAWKISDENSAMKLDGPVMMINIQVLQKWQKIILLSLWCYSCSIDMFLKHGKLKYSK